jgi:hypothetical protein
MDANKLSKTNELNARKASYVSEEDPDFAASDASVVNAEDERKPSMKL